MFIEFCQAVSFSPLRATSPEGFSPSPAGRRGCSQKEVFCPVSAFNDTAPPPRPRIRPNAQVMLLSPLIPRAAGMMPLGNLSYQLIDHGVFQEQNDDDRSGFRRLPAPLRMAGQLFHR
jgi:hypothetical protein